MNNINDVVITMIVTTLVILLLLAGVIIIIILANKKRVQQDIKMAEMAVDYEKELRTVESEVQEQTLTNVSRELHDNIGQLLTLVRLQLEQETLDDPILTEKLSPLDNTLTDTIEQVRLLSHSLNTDHLEQSGLLQAIDKEVTRISQLKTTQIHWQHHDKEPSIDKDKRVMIFRIFQELLNNTLKHARAKNIYINMEAEDNFSLTIKDDGVGFDLETIINSSKGSGLQNMLKRAKLANLTLNIDTTINKGSIFTLSQL